MTEEKEIENINPFDFLNSELVRIHNLNLMAKVEPTEKLLKIMIAVMSDLRRQIVELQEETDYLENKLDTLELREFD